MRKVILIVSMIAGLILLSLCSCNDNPLDNISVSDISDSSDVSSMNTSSKNSASSSSTTSTTTTSSSTKTISDKGAYTETETETWTKVA